MWGKAACLRQRELSLSATQANPSLLPTQLLSSGHSFNPPYLVPSCLQLVSQGTAGTGRSTGGCSCTEVAEVTIRVSWQLTSCSLGKQEMPLLNEGVLQPLSSLLSSPDHCEQVYVSLCWYNPLP